MSLVDEYRAQFAFRDWAAILAAVPVRAGDGGLVRRGATRGAGLLATAP